MKSPVEESVRTLSRRVQGSSRGPSPTSNLTLRPQRIGDDENIEKMIAASKLKRRISCSVTSAASSGVKQRSRKPPALARTSRYSGQVAAGLTHHPERRNRLPPPGKHFQQRFDGWSLCQAAFPFLADNYDCQS